MFPPDCFSNWKVEKRPLTLPLSFPTLGLAFMRLVRWKKKKQSLLPHPLCLSVAAVVFQFTGFPPPPPPPPPDAISTLVPGRIIAAGSLEQKFNPCRQAFD